MEYHVQPLSLDAFGEPLHRFDAFTASVCNLNPTSRGHGEDPLGRPGTRPRSRRTTSARTADRRVAGESLRSRGASSNNRRWRATSRRRIKPGVQYQTDDELARLAGDIGTTIFHPVGTCEDGRTADDPMPRWSTPAARARRGRPAGRRRRRDAHHHQRQHQQRR
jgi:choline dehydrogenase